MAIRRSEISSIQKDEVVLIGLPWDQYSSFLQGPSKAPPLIIDAMESDSANYFTEDLINLNEHPGLCWAGNTEIDEYFQISEIISAFLDKDAIPFSLGGDHSITYPIIKSFYEKYDDLTILHFDAHGDLYDELDGNRYSHACPFARIMEKGLAKKLIQVGIRTMTQHQREQADRFGVEVHQMKDPYPLIDLDIEGPLYISFDMDVLDPAFAPGVSHHEPGGMSTRQAIDNIQNVTGNIVGIDVVEYNPDRDINQVTAMTAAKIVKELLAKVLQ